MGTEHAGLRALLPGVVAAALALALTGCSGGGSPSSLAGVSSAHLGSSAGATDTAASPSPGPSTGAGLGVGASSPATSAAGGGYASAALPAGVWTNPSAIPLYAAYHWRSPAAVDKKASVPVLTAVQDCQPALSADDKSELAAFPAAQADLTPTSGGTGGQDDWTAQETVLSTGDTSSGDIQGIYMLYTDLVSQISKCAATATGAKLTSVSSTRAGYSATITIPTSTGTTLTVHEYLAAPYGYLVELSVWVAPYSGDKPGAAWDGASSSAVLAALSTGPCALSKAC
ncbi:hypothetical protein [Actinospica robiniae]|uniref:hypothetical protein n=1 Tax=Actinospica robiniae TaxID=304901 RepID=UPI0004132788|nr:hypothetical protein [Actinospica robiniae]